MSRPRKPTKLLELTGAFKKNPNRARPNEPSVNTKGFDKSAPEHLSAHEKECWDELVVAIPQGVLSASDITSLEIVACLLAEFRVDSVGMSTTRIGMLTAELGKFGLDPRSRSSMGVRQLPESNPFLDD